MTEGASGHHVDVLADPSRVAAVLSPIRRRLLENLESPDSASGLARKLGLPRQKVNYHIRELERAGFLELMAERQQRGCTERLVRVTSRAFLISEDFLGNLAANPDNIRDSFSSAYLIAAAGRVVRDAATLRERAKGAGQKLATLAVETEVSFKSAADFNAFSEELAGQLARLALKYNRSGEMGARRFRVLLASHPTIKRGLAASETNSAIDNRKPRPQRRKNR